MRIQSDEPRKRLNRVRSVKVTNLDRFRVSMKKTKSRLNQEMVLPDDSLDMVLKQKESPNYMKATSCFNARRGYSQPNAGDNSIARNSAKSMKRMYSLKRLRKLPSMKSESKLNSSIGNAELKLIRSGSIKITRVTSIQFSRKRWSKTRLDKASVFITDDEAADEISSDSDDAMMSDDDLQKNEKSSVSAAGLKPTRTLWKMPSLSARRRQVKKFDRATCSSALKSSKVHSSVYESEDLIGHVCPYSYCSLHGHLHAPSPPLKGFISTKRRLLKKQRSIRLKRRLSNVARDVSRMKPSMQEHEDPHDSEEMFVEIYEPITEPRKANADIVESDELRKQSSATDILVDSKKYSNMWKLIYKHLSVPGTEVISEEGENEKDRNENATDTEGSDCNLNHDHQDENQDMNLDSNAADSDKLEFNQNEAIEFVQRAVDEMLNLDEQSPLYPVSPNTVLNHVEELPSDSAKDGIRADNIGDDENPELKDMQQEKNGAIVAKHPGRQRSKGFEKLRKMMITAKFVKAVEKLRRINPRKPRYLSAEAKAQVERVQLRHLSFDGRKNTEEWMLDFALQQVIGKLAPAQQRRVTMLVEAFENIHSDPSKIPSSNYIARTTDVLKEERSIAIDLDSSGLCDNASLATPNSEDQHPQTVDSGSKPALEVASNQSIMQQVDETTDDPTVDSSCEETNISFDKEKFTNVWHMVYRQFIANEDTVSGEKKVDENEQEDVNASSNIERSDSSLSEIDVKDDVKQGDAMQLVQEAIDELLRLHEQLSDQKPSKSCVPGPTDRSLEVQVTQLTEQETTDTDNQKALQRQISKPLSKLKKLVLSAKFIKTMEKLRKIRTCKTVNLSSQVSEGPGSEKVCLRHLSMDERRNSGEWMLDNALQQVISKLAPAQQRKVALLTQAFETFTPELQQISTKYTRLKTQPEEDTSSSTKPKTDEDDLLVPANIIQPEGCPPFFADITQVEYKEDTDFKTEHHDEQTFVDSRQDDHKADVQTNDLEERKYSKMWQLIYQHVKSNSSTESETETSEIRPKEDQTDDVAGKKLEITQSDAIKLVQEAVDGILHQSNSSEELSVNVSKETAFKGYSKWKKAIICSKFVKAMEKMQKLDVQKKRRNLNLLIQDQEAEIVHLRHCLMDERSNSEEWMLDHALRQVIAKLAPVQQQKVAVLIEAFETVGPNTEETSRESRCQNSDNKDCKEETSLESSDICNKNDFMESMLLKEMNATESYATAGECSESQDTNNDSENKILLDGQKYSGLWRLIYRHIKSGLPNAETKNIITDENAEQVPSETDTYGPASDVETLDEETPCDSPQSYTDNENADHSFDSKENIELQQKDAIKLVEEAVNEILQMEVQSCDEQQLIDSEKKTKEDDKGHQEPPRSYSVLSKVILCKKFIKAVEKMKNSNPKDQTAENVRLRAQRMEEKNCEEWMLDYALQQVVGKLAPTQKKKVSMLVEAFERVNPLPDSRRYQRLNPVAR